MIRTVQKKLFGFIVLISVMTMATMFSITYSLQQGFIHYVNEDDRTVLYHALVHTYHDEKESWAFFQQDSADWPEWLSLALPLEEIKARLILLDAKQNPLLGQPSEIPKTARPAPLLDDAGHTLAYFYLRPKEKLKHPHNLAFLKLQKTTILYTSIPILLISLVLSFLAARILLRPIELLTRGIKLLAQGQYSTRFQVKSLDEIGRLANDLNSLALTLEHNEQDRQKLTADISHELRTPLTILHGEITALVNGIRPITPEALASLNDEVILLTRLVNDLHQLSLYDISALKFNMAPITPQNLLLDVVDLFRHQFGSKGIAIKFSPPPPPAPQMFGDSERLTQLFFNLLTNCLKFTDANGLVEVIVEHQPGMIIIIFQDSPPAVPEKELHLIFDRLYRVDHSRNSASGGSGLGLAICQSIVTAHSGTIAAGPSPLGGLKITINLPVIEMDEQAG